MGLTSVFRRRANPRKLQAVLPELRALLRELDLVERTADPIDRLILLFRAVAPWQDRGGVRDLINLFTGNDLENVRIRSLLQGLETEFTRAGRNLYGINRTRPGQPITEHNVWLGSVDSLSTHSAATWRSQGKTFPIETPGLGKVTAYEIVCRYAADFVRSHINAFRAIIKELDAVSRS